EAIPEFPGIEAAGLTEKLALLRNRNVIDYHAVAQAKLIGLRLAHEAFRKHASPQRRKSLASFLANHPLPLARFACFELLRRRFTGPWWEWPEEWRRADASSIARLHRDEPEVGFFEFVQWVAHEQLERCQACKTAAWSSARISARYPTISARRSRIGAYGPTRSCCLSV